MLGIAGMIIATFVATPCSFAQERDDESVEIILGQNEKNILSQNSNINAEENETQNSITSFYAIDRVNIRTLPNEDSEILLTVDPGTKLECLGKSESGWNSVLVNGIEYYVSQDFVTIDEPIEVARSVEEQLADAHISETDFRYMASIIFAEAGNQCKAGQQAVGIVVMERIKSPEFKNTVYDVIHEPRQFSPVRDGNLKKALSLYDQGKLPNETLEAARYALRGNTTVDYNGTTYDLSGYLYFSRYVKGCRLKIQDHMFK